MDLLERFLKYVSFHTTSDENSETAPSTARQLKLGEYLRDELTAIGMSDAVLDEYGRVYAFLPANTDTPAAPIGFIAHMDVSPAVPGDNIKPQVIEYNGGDIQLANGDKTEVAKYPFLENYVGQTLIITDGNTLLGADDKAGVSEIVTAMEYLIAHPEIKHGRIAVAFTPDEEIGCGADHFDHARFASEYAYTVDGGALGELEYENFNAAGAEIRIAGVNVHPGSAKNIMKSAVLIGAQFISMLPPAETPAHTEGYEGFYHVCDFTGDETSAVIHLIIRDHDMEKFTSRKQFVSRAAEYLDRVYGDGTVTLMMRDSYYNMKEKILPVMHVVERAENAFKAAGVTPKVQPIRGGTDGARLSFEGLPCPNLSTGGENFHGVHEFASYDAMKKMVEVIINIAECQ